VAGVKSPQHGTLDLSSTFAAKLIKVGVLPKIVCGSGEATVTVQQ
jgi:hypothetical protein